MLWRGTAGVGGEYGDEVRGELMFGSLFGPRWVLEFKNDGNPEFFVLESDSIGMLLGYVIVPIERGLRPSADWEVSFRHSSKRFFLIDRDWPTDNHPDREIISTSLNIDKKLVRAKNLPLMFQIVGAKKVPMSLESSIRGKPVSTYSLQDRIDFVQHGVRESESIHAVVNRIFTAKFNQ